MTLRWLDADDQLDLVARSIVGTEALTRRAQANGYLDSLNLALDMRRSESTLVIAHRALIASANLIGQHQRDIGKHADVEGRRVAEQVVYDVEVARNVDRSDLPKRRGPVLAMAQEFGWIENAQTDGTLNGLRSRLVSLVIDRFGRSIGSQMSRYRFG